MIERYRLILKHEYIDDDGIVHKIEDPYVIDSFSPVLAGYGCPPAIRVNAMLDQFKHELLSRMSQEVE